VNETQNENGNIGKEADMQRRLMWTALIVTALALMLSPAGWAEEGVSANEIQIGQWGPQTGPAAAWGQ